MRKTLSRFTRKGQLGQSIVILALGFVGLIAVVGIVTDVSILFARYAQLRRAVDSASIAAAGQMREDRTIADVSLAARQFIEFHGIDPSDVWVETCGNAPIYDNNDATVGIQPPSGQPLTELDPEICSGDQRKLVRVTAQVVSPTVFLRLVGWGDVILEASAISETAVLDVVLIMDVSESMLNETTYADWAEVGMGRAYIPPLIDDSLEWSKANPPDTVLTRIMDPTIRASVSELSATPDIPPYDAGAIYAAFDPSRTSTLFTLDTDYDNDGIQPNELYADWFWGEYHLGVSQEEVNQRLYFPGAPDAPANPNTDPLAANATDLVHYEVESFIPSDVAEIGGTEANQGHPREACRVRFFPYSRSLQPDDYLIDPVDGIYTTALADNLIDEAWNHNIATQPNNWKGFVPTFDFYGCCNDPGTQAGITPGGGVDVDGNIFPRPTANSAPDGDFSDLVCQPFKAARDATRLFLERIDFTRGDRVAYVTFDRGAFLIDPDGTSGSGVGGASLSHMIEDLPTARRVLNQYIGVRAEPNFYDWSETAGGWDGFAAGIDENGNSIPIDYTDTELNFFNPGSAYYQNPIANNYPARDNCQIQNTTLVFPYSRFNTRNVPGMPPNEIALRNTMTPNIYGTQYGVDWNSYRANPNSPDLNNNEHIGSDIAANEWKPDANAYNYWASCRGTNIGAGLRQASTALTFNPQVSRSEGTVWVMILLSDGAAGASDPARANGQKINDYNVYDPRHTLAGYPAGYNWSLPDPNPSYTLFGRNPITDPLTNTYGAYGVCPPGARQADGTLTLGELMRTGSPGGEPRFPFCSDERPATRHFCLASIQATLDGIPSSVGRPNFTAGFGPNAEDRDYDINQSVDVNLAQGNIYDIDIGNYGAEESCDPLYDVDDYARDWADFITGIPPVGVPNFDLNQGVVLPTIFTIGFGLNFENDTDGDGERECTENVEDCLGEELLRYIADVGDNFRVDTDYQQDWRYRTEGEGGGKPSLGSANLDYGPPDPCQPSPDEWEYEPGVDTVGTIQFRTAGESCGNYYNAPGQAELEQVFNDIASRMFTRLTG